MARFILRDPNGKESTLIYMVFRFKNKRLVYPTGKKTTPDAWNPRTQRIRKGYPHEVSINKYLSKLSTIAEESYTGIQIDGKPITVGVLRHEIERAVNKNDNKDTFLGFVERFIEESKHKKTSTTIFRTSLKYLRAYRGAKNWSDIDAKWMKSYIGYLESIRVNKYKKDGKWVSEPLTVNYIRKLVSVLRQFLNEAVEQGKMNNLSYKSRKVMPKEEEAETIYLTKDDLSCIKNVTLPEGQDRARDLFLVSAFTGLRYSDFSKLRHADVGDEFITKRTQKTGEIVVIPISPVVREIIAKYGGFPSPISNQKMNDHLKEVGKRAGLTRPVVKTRTLGGVRKSKTYPLYELITCHTGRRSFATNAFLDGVPSISIRKITGHKTEASFMKYIRISQIENAISIKSHPFFVSPL